MRQSGTRGHTPHTMAGSSNSICRHKQSGSLEVDLSSSRGRTTSAFAISPAGEETHVRDLHLHSTRSRFLLPPIPKVPQVSLQVCLLCFRCKCTRCIVKTSDGHSCVTGFCWEKREWMWRHSLVMGKWEVFVRSAVLAIRCQCRHHL